MIQVLRRRLEDELDNDLEQELQPTATGANYFRFQLYQWMESNFSRIVNREDPMFVDARLGATEVVPCLMYPREAVSLATTQRK